MKKNKKKTRLDFIFSLEIVPLDIVVSIGDWEASRKWFTQLSPDFREKTANYEPGSYATCFYDIKSLYRNPKTQQPQLFLYFHWDAKDKPDYEAFAGRIAHEAVHLTFGISEMFGDFFNPQVQEPQAYLVQRVVNTVLKNYRKELLNK